MIKKMIINNAATFKSPVEVNPRRINYIYGGNGSGKTTISRIIDDIESYQFSTIEWEKNIKLDSIVYNRDFIKNNFEQDELKGIFTLGKDVPDAEKKINDKINVRTTLENRIVSLKESIEKNEEEINGVTEQAKGDCWTVKTTYSSNIKESLTGSIGSGIAFFKKCIAEQENTAELKNLNELEKKNSALFKRELVKIDCVTNIDLASLSALENNKIFREPIIGNKTSIVGELISHLNNSDWVYQGISYFKKTKENKCPYCQQKIGKELSLEIENYFDESFKRKSDELDIAIDQYKNYISILFLSVETIIKEDNELYDFEKSNDLLNLAKEIYEKNLIVLDKKVQNKSIIANLESLNDITIEIKNEIQNYINLVNEHNTLVDNIKKERLALSHFCWRFMAENSKSIIKRFTEKKMKIESAITKLQSKISEEKGKLNAIIAEIESIEASITSVQHSANEINRILKGFHFNGFKLKESEYKKGHYQIVREDGSIATKTLSEGEYTFITFLYFYYLVHGSISKSGVNNRKIVVIDDPISSLDSSVLFIVSNLVKTIINEMIDNYKKSLIRQLFILTHNIYFHKEISFKGQRKNTTSNEFFWLVYKTDNESNIKTSTKNPINTTYAILWDEIKSVENTNRVTIFNNLRRILEYYFKIIGNYNYEEIVNKFEFEDQQTCKALISWINDGSHFINDDLLIETEIESVDRYLKIFKDIFEKLGHISHYNMMLGIK